jgi:hypothetical protein
MGILRFFLSITTDDFSAQLDGLLSITARKTGIGDFLFSSENNRSELGKLKAFPNKRCNR